MTDLVQKQIHAMLKEVLRNQVRLAYMLAQSKAEPTGQLQDRANRIGLETQRMFNQMGFGDL